MTGRRRVRAWSRLIAWGLVTVGLVVGLGRSWGAPPLGRLLDPVDGLYRTARHAEHPSGRELVLASLDAPVSVLRDERGVPHIFAESDRDAVVAFGYVTAQDRLFQLDFIPRVASGRLSELFGPASLEADRFLRRTGMEWGARKHVARMEREGGIEYDLARWFSAGANAYIDALDERDLPFEFRLLGAEPDRYGPLQMARLLQYFAYDLTYRTDDPGYEALRQRLGDAEFERLYPRHNPLSVPIIPGPGRDLVAEPPADLTPQSSAPRSALGPLIDHLLAEYLAGADGPASGFREGKGSNNWVVDGAHSASGAPLLAGDMHLSLTLPAIWYEAHLVTPTMNSYGVGAPGTPVPIEAFTPDVGWTFTNTGADVVDHYALDLDSTGTRYRFGDGFRALELVSDTIRVKGASPVVDTLRYAHWGPVVIRDTAAVALRWTAHEPGRTLRALWKMHHADGYASFEDALRDWDTPMQNIAYAGRDGTIAIRSTGYLPIRAGGEGVGLLDGSRDASAWAGRVPFEMLPHAVNPAHGYLTSTNQEPTDASYPLYMGHDWRSAYRSLRIDSLLRSRPQHAASDFMRYQSDVRVVQRDLFVPLLKRLDSLEAPARDLLDRLAAWDGVAGLDRAEPLMLDTFLDVLADLAWDEPEFNGLRRPSESTLLTLLRDVPESPWLDVRATGSVEEADGLLRLALSAAADSLRVRYGADPDGWRWDRHHRVIFRHVTQSPALRPLWRGPFPYPGFASTLSPAAGRPTTHSASWRVVVDFSTVPPTAYGIYPGGQSGNPFSKHYDSHLSDYVAFQHYTLRLPESPEALDAANVSARLRLQPALTD